MKKILMVAGGTAGHVRPAWVLGNYLASQGASLFWIGSYKNTWLPNFSWPCLWVDLEGLWQQGWYRWVRLPDRLLRACLRIAWFIYRHRIEEIWLMGGYMTLPVAMVAMLLRVPYCVFEQNCVLGFSNRWAALGARRVYSGFPLTPPREDVVGTANPLPEAWSRPSEYKVLEPIVHLLVIGGSLGARCFQERLPACLAPWKDRIAIRHIAGRLDPQKAMQNYAEHGLQAECFAYVEDMQAHWQWADVVIARAGAMTMSELIFFAVPALLIPYPQAANQHQHVNARWLASLGGGEWLEEDFMGSAAWQEAMERLLTLSIWQERRSAMLSWSTETWKAIAYDELMG